MLVCAFAGTDTDARGLCARDRGAATASTPTAMRACWSAHGRDRLRASHRSPPTARPAPACCTTAHGDVATPAFMPVGTAGTVKAMTADAVRATGARHRARQHLPPDAAARRRTRRAAGRAAPVHGLAGPDPDRFRRLPGHVAGQAAQARRRRRDVPVASRRLHASADAGALDRDPASAGCHDHHGAGRVHARSRRRRTQARASMQLSMRWAPQSREAFVDRAGYGLFGIVQGSVYPGPARSSRPRALTGIGFDGYAIGGLAIGEGQATMFAVLDATVPHLPDGRAALPDGRRHAGRPHRRGAARHRHVRLRDTDARRPHRARLHLARRVQPAQRPVRRRCGAARRRLRLPGLRTPQPRLSAPPVQGGGDARADAADLAQCDATIRT